MSTRLSGTYVQLHQRKEPYVGLLLLVLVLSVVIAAWVWFRPGVGGGRHRVAVSVMFENTRGLTVADPVMVAGARVGRVTSVDLEDVGRVRVGLAIDGSVQPMEDAWAQIRPLNMTGDVFVAYRPGTSTTPLPAGRSLAGAGADEGAWSAEDLIDGIRRLATGAATLTGAEVRAELQETLGTVGDALEALRGLDAEPLVTAARASLESVQRAAAHLDATMSHPALDSARLRAGSIREHATDLADGLTASRAALDRILERMDRGEGNLGRWRSDTTLRSELAAVRSALRRPS